MDIVLWIAFGVAAGALARMVMPGPRAGGIGVAMLLGGGAALIGGFIGHAIGDRPETGIDHRSLLMAMIGTLFVLLAYRAYAMRGGDAIAPRHRR